jgi:hypothetical protein
LIGSLLLVAASPAWAEDVTRNIDNLEVTGPARHVATAEFEDTDVQGLRFAYVVRNPTPADETGIDINFTVRAAEFS